MRLQYQKTDYGCFQACVATITGTRLSRIPDFYACGAEGFHEAVKLWNRTNNKYLLMDIPYSEGRTSKTLGDIPIIVTGTSPRDNTMLHSVIYKNWELLHDPYKPDQSGIIDPVIITLVLNK